MSTPTRKTTTTTNSPTFPDHCRRHLLRLTWIFTSAFTALIFTWQLLRVAQTLPPSLLSPRVLLGVFVAVTPALLTLTGLLGALIAMALTYGRVHEAGELMGYRTLGGELGPLSHGVQTLALALIILNAGLTSFAAPWALARGQEVIADLAPDVVLAPLYEGRALQIDATQSLTGRPAALEGQRVVRDVRYVRRHAAGDVVMRADVMVVEVRRSAEHLTLTLRARSPVMRLGRDRLEADQLTLTLRSSHPHALGIPDLETFDVAELWRRGLSDDRRALGQLSKRLVLVGAPWVWLLALWVGFVTRPQPTSVALLVALVACGGVHVCARGAELMTRDMGWAGVGGTGALLVFCGAVAYRGLRASAERW